MKNKIAEKRVKLPKYIVHLYIFTKQIATKFYLELENKLERKLEFGNRMRKPVGELNKKLKLMEGVIA